MKVYNVIVSNGKWTSSEIFPTEERARKHVENLEFGQREIEGDCLKHLFRYDERDCITPPFHAYGKRIYLSYAWTAFGKNENEGGCTWRAIFEHEI